MPNYIPEGMHDIRQLACLVRRFMPNAKKRVTRTISIPIGSMYAIYGNIYHQYTPNVSIYTIHGSYGIDMIIV